jgi:hypothetical protein
MRRKHPRRSPETKTPLLDPRTLGLAAVAAELNLEVDTLEPEVGQAVQKGAASLYLAGYGPRSGRVRARRHIDKGDRRANAGRVEAASTGHAPTPIEPPIPTQNTN